MFCCTTLCLIMYYAYFSYPPLPCCCPYGLLTKKKENVTTNQNARWPVWTNLLGLGIIVGLLQYPSLLKSHTHTQCLLVLPAYSPEYNHLCSFKRPFFSIQINYYIKFKLLELVVESSFASLRFEVVQELAKKRQAGLLERKVVPFVVTIALQSVTKQTPID